MGKTFVFVNQKGGVGKTTSAINIGAYMALAGRRVLLVDFDSQGNMSSGLGVGKEHPNVYEFINGESEPSACVRHTSVKNLDAIASSIEFANAAVELARVEGSREFFLREALDPLRDSYDFILIDCPPSLGLFTLNGLAASDAILVPMQCEYFALEGISLLRQTVEGVQKTYNPSLKIGGIFFTMYSKTILAQEVIKEVKRQYADEVLDTVIPRNVRLSEAPSHGMPICEYDPGCVGAKSYRKLAEEVMGRG